MSLFAFALGRCTASCWETIGMVLLFVSGVYYLGLTAGNKTRVRSHPRRGTTVSEVRRYHYTIHLQSVDLLLVVWLLKRYVGMCVMGSFSPCRYPQENHLPVCGSCSPSPTDQWRNPTDADENSLVDNLNIEVRPGNRR